VLFCYVQNLWLPKAGSSNEEYEDASSHEKTQGDLERTKPRFAIADGATESSFSREWARMLVASNSRGTITQANIRKRVEALGQRWLSQITARPLPWYAERKVQEGAFATFLGLSLGSGGGNLASGGRWNALAVGDSCLFQVREDELIASFPLMRAEGFGYRPLLLSSIPERNQAVWDNVEQLTQTGGWLSGDTFLLLTDALAHWFLGQVEQGARPWQTVAEIVEQSVSSLYQFGEWIVRLRQSGAMRNDDVTLLRVNMG
jgi:hypothetical protein